MTLLPASFQHRITLLFAGIALLVGVPVSMYVSHTYSNQLIEDRGRALQELAFAVATVLSENLHERQREIEYLVETARFHEEILESENFVPILEGLQKSHRYYSWIGFAEAAGTVRAATGHLLVGENVTGEPWFANGMKGSFVGDLHESPRLAELLPPDAGMGSVRFIDFAAPVFDTRGIVRGVIGAHVHWVWADEAIRAIIPLSANEQRMDVLIANKVGQVLYPMALDNLSVPATAAFKSTFSIESWSSDTEYVTASAFIREVTPDDPLSWRIIIRQPKEVALKDVKALQRVLFVSVFVATVLFLCLVWWCASMMSRPVRQLAKFARRVEQGEETTRLEVPTSTAELRQLVDAVRGMASTLIHRKLALEDSNTRLEQRVQERTAELERLNGELVYLARRDALTTLANRMAANERLRDEFLRMKRTGVAYSVLLLDIDFFKRINDTLGHATGDQVLRHVAKILKSSLRQTDFVARFGGEEFIVLLPATDTSDARIVAENIRHAVEVSPPDEVERVTVSVGVATANPQQAAEDEAVHEADEKLYEAKHAGRNCVAS
ncbi:sensor domain-containing diguanylate cyclase [Propionivibrio soli]|uniref:sensor domain-containing diguanylate cyclase n=1 Tax=Propionivibrio soli TaxID=2976531 RepID=UPI0021E93FCE|nr:diguanylate cyclase [Propionivibrio soli]